METPCTRLTGRGMCVCGGSSCSPSKCHPGTADPGWVIWVDGRWFGGWEGSGGAVPPPPSRQHCNQVGRSRRHAAMTDTPLPVTSNPPTHPPTYHAPLPRTTSYLYSNHIRGGDRHAVVNITAPLPTHLLHTQTNLPQPPCWPAQRPQTPENKTETHADLHSNSIRGADQHAVVDVHQPNIAHPAVVHLQSGRAA